MLSVLQFTPDINYDADIKLSLLLKIPIVVELILPLCRLVYSKILLATDMTRNPSNHSPRDCVCHTTYLTQSVYSILICHYGSKTALTSFSCDLLLTHNTIFETDVTILSFHDRCLSIYCYSYVWIAN